MDAGSSPGVDRSSDFAGRFGRCADGNATTTGAALLVTSHDMREVEMLTERVIFLARGAVVANDTPAAIVAEFGHLDLEAVFLELAETHGR